MDGLDRLVADTLMERPVMFKIGDEVFSIYPLTLGKMYLLQEATDAIGIGGVSLDKGAELKMLNMVKEKRETVCELLSYMTARNDYYCVFDVKEHERRKSILMEQEDAELATLLIAVLTSDKTEELMKGLGLSDEARRMQKVIDVKVKDDKNTYTFGGLSIFGSLIDEAMERYKLSKRSVVWEFDYTSLRLLLADRVNSIYVTDDERRKIRVPNDRVRVNGDDKEALLRAIKSQSWE